MMQIDIQDNFLPAINSIPVPAVLPLESPYEILTRNVLSLLHSYTSESEAKSLLAQARNSPTYYDPSIVDGYIPISLLLSFKKMSKVTTDFNEIVRIASKSHTLQVHPDGTKIRRKLDQIEFNNTTNNNNPQQSISLKSTGFIIAKRFTSDTIKEEVAMYFSQFGVVIAVEFIQPGIAGIKFMDDDAIAKTMVQAQNLTGLRFRGDSLNVEWEASSETDMLEFMSRLSISASSNSVKDKNKKYARKTAGPYTYTVNRILHLDLSGLKWEVCGISTDDDDDVISEIEQAPAIIKKLLDPYAHVVDVSIERTSSAYVRLKQPVANEIFHVIQKSGGVVHPDYQVALPVRCVKGDEERIYWHVCCARESAIGGPLRNNMNSSSGRRKWRFVSSGGSSLSERKRKRAEDVVSHGRKMDCQIRKNKKQRGIDRIQVDDEQDDPILVENSVPVKTAKKKSKKLSVKQLKKKAKKMKQKAKNFKVNGENHSEKMDLADMLSQL